MKIVVLDGGMGTTLEAQGHDVSSPMWGCELVAADPAAITAVHAGFVDAGAGLVETATYQLTRAALEEAGHTPASAEETMRAAVRLACSACARSPSVRETGVVLSLGPYGATLRPGQEYAGRYPPPYGPGTDTNYAAGAELEGYVAALTEFHLSRLRIYAVAPEWADVKFVAFETVPAVSEILAVRRAMSLLAAEGKHRAFWITCAFPNGKHGQLDASGDSVSVQVLVDAMLSGAGERPAGVGINCTNPDYLRALCAQFSSAVAARQLESRPWLVVYPDGGAVYDVVSRSWTAPRDGFGPAQWADELVAVARVQPEDTWAGVIVGGCCKSSFVEIAALRRAVDAVEGR